MKYMYNMSSHSEILVDDFLSTCEFQELFLSRGLDLKGNSVDIMPAYSFRLNKLVK